MIRIDWTQQHKLVKFTKQDKDESVFVGKFKGLDVWNYTNGKDKCFYLIKNNIVVSQIWYDIISSNIWKIIVTQVDRKFQGFGFVPKFYKWLMKKHNVILQAGIEQSAGGRNMWAQLADVKGVSVYAVKGKQSF